MIGLWMIRPGRWRGRAVPRHAGRMQWRVGALRSGAENIAWTSAGDAPDWDTARSQTIAALRDLVAAEGRQEYRLQIDGQDGIVTPGLDTDGQVTLADLDRAVPADRYWS